MSRFVFPNTHKLEDGVVMTYLTGKELVELWMDNKIAYIPEIQRGVKKVESDDGTVKDVAVYNKSNVNSIKETILNDSFYVSQITLNVLKEDAIFEYDEEKREVTIDNDILALSDGQHRIRAMADIYKENPEFDLSKLTFPIKISHYNEEKAQEQFYQYTLGNKISSSRKEYFNNKNYANKIVKGLYQDSVLTGKIETVKNIIGKNEKIKVVSFATLKNALELNFNTNKLYDDSEATEILVFLKKFFAKLFDVIPEFSDFEARTQLKENQSLKCENFTFYGYLAVAEYLFHNQQNWEKSMDILPQLDYAKDSSIWAGQVTKKNIIKRKSKNQTQELKYTIINNSQSRKEMSSILLKLFKKVKYDAA